MYAAHFGLTSEPFNLAPNPDSLYLGKQYREALSALQYGLADRRGFITLIGEVGTGKTTILYQLLSELPPDVDAAFVSYADQPFGSLLSYLLHELDVPHDPTSEPSMLSALTAHLHARDAQGRTVAFVIDEAQNLDDATLERLRILSNIETFNRKLLQIVLVGQPELQTRMHEPHQRQLNERVSVRAYLSPMPRRELQAYVEHRLQRAGGALDELCSFPARQALLLRARGFPRRANILFHNALLFTCGQQGTRVRLPMALAAIREMNDHPVRRWWTAFARSPQPALATAGLLAMVYLLGREARQWIGPPLPEPVRVAQVQQPVAPVAPLPPPVAQPPSVPPVAVPPSVPPVAHAEEAVPPPQPDEVKAPPQVVASVRTEPAARDDVQKAPPAAESDGTMLLWVARGATLHSLALQMHGRQLGEEELTKFIAAVRELNPEMTDPNLIFARSLLRVPVPSSTTPRG